MSNKNSKKSQRGRRNAKTNPTTSYFGPSYGVRTQTQARMTLDTYYTIYTGVTATNGFAIPVNWPAFQQGNAVADQWRYYEVTGWMIDVTFPTTTAVTDSFISGAIAWYPINQFIDGLATDAPSGNPNDVLRLPGAVNVKEGQANKGKWFRNPSKQVYPTRFFAPSGTTNAGSIIGYFNDLGVSELACSIQIYCDVVFYGQRYNITPLTLTNVVRLDKEERKDSTDVIGE